MTICDQQRGTVLISFCGRRVKEFGHLPYLPYLLTHGIKIDIVFALETPGGGLRAEETHRFISRRFFWSTSFRNLKKEEE